MKTMTIMTILAMMAVALVACEGTPEERARTAALEEKVDAWMAAETFVKRQLVSPGNANFGSLFGEYQNPERQVTKINDVTFRVRGWVDAQNAFGGTIRKNFHVTVVREGTQWRQTDISIW